MAPASSPGQTAQTRAQADLAHEPALVAGGCHALVQGVDLSRAVAVVLRLQGDPTRQVQAPRTTLRSPRVRQPVGAGTSPSLGVGPAGGTVWSSAPGWA
ncbi:hypothetical protein ABL57_15425 [Kocuria sp. SM24M-10]|nr:hypothetical protein ABL57_15425 [Kocuria sp. SM24M-10]